MLLLTMSEPFQLPPKPYSNIVQASSSYYFSTDGNLAFSSEGSTTAIHALTNDGGIGEQVDDVYMVLEEKINNVNKTRAAVIYGDQAFDMNADSKGFVPYL
ncbi:hypothetical protein ACHAP5_009529 [Fusarium lateritium]